MSLLASFDGPYIHYLDLDFSYEPEINKAMFGWIKNLRKEKKVKKI